MKYIFNMEPEVSKLRELIHNFDNQTEFTDYMLYRILGCIKNGMAYSTAVNVVYEVCYQYQFELSFIAEKVARQFVLILIRILYNLVAHDISNKTEKLYLIGDDIHAYTEGDDK